MVARLYAGSVALPKPFPAGGTAMKKSVLVLLMVILLASTLFFTNRIPVAGAKELKILEFDTMVGVPKAYTAGFGNPIRGINGGGLPWVVGSAKGELKASGKLEVKVTGLVFDPNDPDVIARGLAGRNTVAQFKAIVSCQTVDANGNATIVNLSTGLFPATLGLASEGGGNAKIEEMLNLPKPCIAPIIFVTSPSGAWFAATGN